jgi:hypothetical protein
MTTIKRTQSSTPKPADAADTATVDKKQPAFAKKPAGRAADGFSATTAAPPPAGVDPAFLPPGFDMNKAVEGLRGVLQAQGVPADQLQPGKITNTAMTDFDGTLGATADTPVYLRAKADVVGADGKVTMKAGDYFKDDKGNDLMIRGITGQEVGNELKALQAKFPSLPWSNVTQDWHAFDDRALAMKTPLNKGVLDSLETPTKDGPTALFVITSRTTQDVAGGIRENVQRQAGNKFASIGVVTTGVPDVQKALGIDSPTLTDGQRKAIVQMVAMTMLGGQNNIKSHRFYEDAVGNDAPAIQALPAKFPGVDTKVFLAMHEQNNHSVPRLVARSNGQGQAVDAKGALWTPDKLTAFATSDPQPTLPLLTPSTVAR